MAVGAGLAESTENFFFCNGFNSRIGTGRGGCTDEFDVRIGGDLFFGDESVVHHGEEDWHLFTIDRLKGICVNFLGFKFRQGRKDIVDCQPARNKSHLSSIVGLCDNVAGGVLNDEVKRLVHFQGLERVRLIGGFIQVDGTDAQGFRPRGGQIGLCQDGIGQFESEGVDAFGQGRAVGRNGECRDGDG